MSSSFAGPEAARAAILAARPAAEWWGARPIGERIDWLLRYRRRLVDQVDELVTLVGRECDKPRLDVVAEVFQCANLIGFLAGDAKKILQPRRVSSFPLFNKAAQIEYRPLGVVGIITPWNYPVVLVLAPVVQALSAGNAVVLKPSEYATKTARFLLQLWEDLRPAAPVWQIVEGGPETAIAVASGGVDKVAFTGGAAGGRAILQAAAQTLTPVLLELGGSDAMLVAADADCERAARGAVWGAFLNAGQSCVAVRRCFVEEPIADQFIAFVKKFTKDLSQGPNDGSAPPDGGADWDHDLGAVRSDGQLAQLEAVVADAVAKGAKLLVGGPSDGGKGRYFPPTVLVNVDSTMRIVQEETFGPLLAILKTPHMEAALAAANRSRFGLGASVWSGDANKAMSLARRLRVGGVVINDCLVHFAVPRLPFGGVKESGFGRSQGVEGLRAFCATCTITRHRFGPRTELQWFPYRDRHRLMKRLLKLMYGRNLWVRLRALWNR